MFKYIALFSITLSSISCVSTHPGVKATSSIQGDTLVVSTDVNKDLSDKYYLFIEYTFENKSDKWKDIKVSRLGFEKQETTEILVNDRLNAWVEGAELKLKKSNFNTAVILGSIAAVGGVAGAVSNNGNLQIAGMAAVAGAAGAGTYLGVQQARQEAKSGNKGINQTVNVPSNYVLAPFKVAPGSYVKRWVVVKKPKEIVVGGELPTKPYRRHSKDMWADENKGGRLTLPSLISEITQNKTTAVYTTSF